MVRTLKEVEAEKDCSEAQKKLEEVEQELEKIKTCWFENYQLDFRDDAQVWRVAFALAFWDEKNEVDSNRALRNRKIKKKTKISRILV